MFGWGIRRLSARQSRHYRNILILLLIIAAVPGLILGAVLHEVAGGLVERELHARHVKQIAQRAHNLDETLSNIELTLTHWAFDPKFDYSLSGHSFVTGFERARDITKTLIVMAGSSPLAKKVELYLPEDGPLLFSPEYWRVDRREEKDAYDYIMKAGTLTYWGEYAYDTSRPYNKDLTLVHHIPGGSPDPFGALIVRLDNQKLSGLLQTMAPYGDGESFLMSKSGDIMATAYGHDPASPFIRTLRDRIRTEGALDGDFFLTLDKTKYTVSYGTLSRINDEWIYVSASPISSITAPVVTVSRWILALSGAVLLVAGLLAWLASRRLYSPIERLVRVLLGGKAVASEDEFKLIERRWLDLNRESRELQTKLDRQLPNVKEGFLHQLLQGYLSSYSEADLLDRMRHYRWEVDDRQFVVLFMRLTGFSGLEGRFSSGDEGLVTFAGVNMIEELAHQRFEQADVMNFHDLTAGILLILPNDRPVLEMVVPFCDEATQAVNQLLRMRLTIAIGRPTRLVSDLPMRFEEARQAVSFRVFESRNQVLDLESARLTEEASEPRYPFTLEREIIQAMRTGRTDEADRLLALFLDTLSEGGAKEIDVQQGMLHLLGSLQHAIMLSGINPSKLFKGVNLYERLSSIREPGRMLSLFRERVLKPYQAELESRSDGHVKKMIEQAMIYLQENYNHDISLDNCAEHIGTNPFFLSKAFKQVTGKNFIDYLTELRMERAKELLRESDLKINDVAVRVGYQHSYFNRIFKKQEGVTPTQYRELNRAT